jgi:hypothetical protein
MKISTTTMLLCLLIPPLSGYASDLPEPGLPGRDTEIRDRTASAGDDWLKRSQETADQWWQSSQETAEELWQRSREAADAAWESTRDYLGRGEPDHFDRLWDQLLPTLEETLVLEERQTDLPERAWFREDRRSNRAAIDELLDEAVSILSTSNVQHYRDRIAALQKEIAQAREHIADYRRRRVSAPEKSMVEKTAADYDQAIAARENDIERMDRELEAIKQELATDLRALGLELSDEQLEILLSTVVGDSLIDLGIVFDNVRAITLQIEQLVEESSEDLESARRYYGMYVVLLKSLRQMHVQVEEAVATEYLPQIDEIIGRARTLSEETRALLKASPGKRTLLTANLEAQALTVEAAGIYRRYLTEQARQVGKARLELEKDIAAAWNTYETVRVSGELVGLVRSSRQLLEGLLDRQVPVLRPFENLELKRELERLTAQLRAS